MTLITAYGQFPRSLMNKEIDMDTDAIKVMLVTSAYVFNKDTHRYKSDITNEVTGTGYTAGGATLASPVLSYDAATDTTNVDYADVVWSNSTITARGAVVYDSTPASDATRPLICFIDFETDQISAGANFTIAWHSLGLLGIVA